MIKVRIQSYGVDGGILWSGKLSTIPRVGEQVDVDDGTAMIVDRVVHDVQHNRVDVVVK